jgi:hypothetical protein
MNLPVEVISDLIELNELGLASVESQKLVAKFLEENPDFKLTKKEEFTKEKMNLAFNDKNEMDILNKTKRTLRYRTFLFAFALFFSLVPLSFGDVSWSKYEGVHWLWIDNPKTAAGIGFVGLCLWFLYYRLNKKINSTIISN